MEVIRYPIISFIPVHVENSNWTNAKNMHYLQKTSMLKKDTLMEVVVVVLVPAERMNLQKFQKCKDG